MTTEWRLISGFDGHYRVSDAGEVQSRRSGEWRSLRPAAGPTGYLTVNLPNARRSARSRYVHDLVVAAFIRPKQAGEVVDHIDRNRANNCVANLRIVSQGENMRNASPHRNKASRFKGVTRHPGDYWRADIKVDGKKKHLGLFRSEVEAASAYDAAARSLFGSVAYQNLQLTGVIQ